MMQKRTITLNGLFTADTQTAELEREQRFLRGRYESPNSGRSLPFAIVPPFAVSVPLGLSGKLRIEAPVSIEGWIVRPIAVLGETGAAYGKAGHAASSGHAASADTPIRSSPVSLPGFPPLPEGTAFILGYAGPDAAALVEALAAEEFTINARYYATLTAVIEFDDESFYGCEYSIGPALWQKDTGSAGQ